jgi:hypothetical protein
MAETKFCYHCSRYHPSDEMRQIDRKGIKRWRCIKSINATKQGLAQRDAFGKTVTALNTAESKARAEVRAHIERANLSFQD